MKIFYEYDETVGVLIRYTYDGTPEIFRRSEGIWRELNSSDDSYMRAIYLGQGCWERLDTITEDKAKQILEEWGCK